MNALTFDYCIADVEVVVVFAPAHLGYEDRQVVLRAALDAEPEAAVILPSQANSPQLSREVRIEVLCLIAE